MDVNYLAITKYVYKEIHQLKNINLNRNKTNLEIKEYLANDDNITVTVNLIYEDTNYIPSAKRTIPIVIPISYFKIIERNSSIDSIFDYNTKYITKKLNDYCGFDINELFKLNDLIDIFGGSLRDIINGDKINDIDILTTSYGAYKIEKFLTSKGYLKMDEYIKKSIQDLYGDIKFIHEPVTYRKDNSYIQIIRPSGFFNNNQNIEEVDFYEMHNKMLSNVDISCCGISFDGLTIKENVKNAILHAKYKKYRVYNNNLMSNPNRLSSRIWKFEQRGYERIETDSEERDMVIRNIVENT